MCPYTGRLDGAVGGRRDRYFRDVPRRLYFPLEIEDSSGAVDRSRNELIEASEHVHFDFSMAVGLSRHLARAKPVLHDPATNQYTSLVSNALISSAAIAIRSLLGFAYERGASRSKDVFATHYVKEWLTVRPSLSPVLEEVAARADKEVAHLSFGREILASARRGWRFLPIYNALVHLHNAFTEHVDGALLLRPLWDATLETSPLEEMPADRTLLDFMRFEETFSPKLYPLK